MRSFTAEVPAVAVSAVAPAVPTPDPVVAPRRIRRSEARDLGAGPPPTRSRS